MERKKNWETQKKKDVSGEKFIQESYKKGWETRRKNAAKKNSLIPSNA